MEDVKQWIADADTKEANYGGMVQGQNSSWSSQFNHSQQGFKTKLTEAATQLE